MLKNVLTIITLFSITITTNAQNINLTWGAESKNDVTYNSFVRGTNNDLIKLCFEEKGRETLPIMTRYNAKLEELTVNNIQVTEDNVKFNRLISIKDGLYFYTNIYDKKAKNTTFYCQPLNIKTFNAEGANISLGTLDALKKSEQSSVIYKLSEDSSKVLMMGLAPFSKADAEKYYLSVYDSKMSKLWDNTVELPYKDKYIEILSEIVTNDGKVAVVLKHYNNETTNENVRKNGKKAPSYITKLLLYSKGMSTPNEYIIDIGDKFVHTLQVAEDYNNDITLFGMYQIKPEGNVNGYFLAKINTTSKSVLTSNISVFPEALLALVKKDKQGSDNEKDGGLGDHFKFIKLVTRENGDKDFLIEFDQSGLMMVRTATGGGYSYMVYKYGDIIDINIKKDGTNVITRIPKMQSSTNDDNFSSFKAIPYKDKLLLFYNDDMDNVSKDLSKKPDAVALISTGTFGITVGGGKAVLTMAVIDEKGNLSRSVLMDKKQSKYLTAINVSFQIEKNKIALYAKKGKKDMVGLLQIE